MAGLGPAWKTDRAATAVAKAQLPGLSCRGDLNDDDPAKVAAVIEKVDPWTRCLVLFSAAPPCQDFSRVTDGPGHGGARGGLFLQTVEFMSEVRRLVAPRRFGFIFENVEMATADAKQITEALGAKPLWADAADFGWVGRPRLWWLSTDWARMTLDPETGEPLQWTRRGQWDRLRVEEARRPVEALDMGDLTFDDSVLSERSGGAQRLQGQDPVRRTAAVVGGSTPVRTLALREGGDGGELRREAADPPPTGQGTASPHAGGLHVEAGRRTARRPRPPPTHWKWVALGCGAAPPADTAGGHGVPALRRQTTRRTTPIDHHLAGSPRCGSLAARSWDRPGHGWSRLGGGPEHPTAVAPRLRREVVQEVKDLIDDMAEQTTKWMSQRSAAVKATYSTPDKPTMTPDTDSRPAGAPSAPQLPRPREPHRRPHSGL